MIVVLNKIDLIEEAKREAQITKVTYVPDSIDTWYKKEVLINSAHNCFVYVATY